MTEKEAATWLAHGFSLTDVEDKQHAKYLTPPAPGSVIMHMTKINPTPQESIEQFVEWKYKQLDEAKKTKIGSLHEVMPIFRHDELLFACSRDPRAIDKYLQAFGNKFIRTSQR